MSVMPFCSTLRNALLANGDGSAARKVTAADFAAVAAARGGLARAAPRRPVRGVDASVVVAEGVGMVVGTRAVNCRSFEATGMNQPIVARSGIRYFAATRRTSSWVTLFTEST